MVAKKKPLKKKQLRKRARARNASAVTKNHPPENRALVGSEERLLQKQLLAWRLRCDGFTLAQIAERIQAEMQLEIRPDKSVVCKWIKFGYEEALGEMTEMASHELMSAVAKLKKINDRFLPMAMGELYIQSFEEVNGVAVEVIDKKAYAEQIKAADLIGKNLERIHKLLAPREEKNPEEIGAGGLRQFQVVLIKNYHAAVLMPGNEPKPLNGRVLSLKSESGLDGQ